MFGTKEQHAEAFRERTRLFVLEIINFYLRLPKTEHSKILGKQLLRSVTSVAANYRAACTASTKNDLYLKLNITLKESEESLSWIKLLASYGVAKPHTYLYLRKENRAIQAELLKFLIDYK